MTMLEKMGAVIEARVRAAGAIHDYDGVEIARAALQAIRKADMDTGLVGAAEVNKEMRGKVKADYCAAQNSFTAMIDAILEGSE